MKKLLQTALIATLVVSLIPAKIKAETGGGSEEQEINTGTNMSQSFTGSAKVVYGDTPSFTVKIPKAIALDSTGTAKYTVGVKGKIPSKYVVSVIPDETITMEEENSLLDSITADVAAEKTTWLPVELNEDIYTESTNNTIQMRSIDLGKFESTLNFNVSAAQAKEIRITYQLDTGVTVDGTNPTSYRTTDGTVTLAPAKKDSHVFLGWYTEPEFTNKIESLDQLKADATLYPYLAEVGSEADLENFIYSLNDTTKTLTLTRYENGTKSNVVIYGKYEVGGKVYDTEITGGIFYNDLNESGNNIITSIVFKPGVKAVGDCTDMFGSCEGLSSIDLTGLDTSEVTDMCFMFDCCSSLIELDVTNFDTSKVTDMLGMFNGCSSLIELDLTHFDTRNVIDMSGMFAGCSSLINLNLTSFDTSKVTNMRNMFDGCSRLVELDFISFNTYDVTDMSYMFNGCSCVRYLDLTSFNTGKVTDMSHMFEHCVLLTYVGVDATAWKTASNSYNMFNSCGVSKVTLEMFHG